MIPFFPTIFIHYFCEAITMVKWCLNRQWMHILFYFLYVCAFFLSNDYLHFMRAVFCNIFFSLCDAISFNYRMFLPPCPVVSFPLIFQLISPRFPIFPSHFYMPIFLFLVSPDSTSVTPFHLLFLSFTSCLYPQLFPLHATLYKLSWS